MVEANEWKTPRASMVHSRRLSDKVLLAFHHACDTGDADVAGDLLKIVAMILARPETPHGRRARDREDLVVAYNGYGCCGIPSPTTSTPRSACIPSLRAHPHPHQPKQNCSRRSPVPWRTDRATILLPPLFAAGGNSASWCSGTA